MFSVLYQAFFNKNKLNNNLKNCNKCGRKIHLKHKFCTYCGNKQAGTVNSNSNEEDKK